MFIDLEFIRQFEAYSPMISIWKTREESSPDMRVFVDFPVVLKDIKGAKKKIRYDACGVYEDGFYGEAQAEDRYGNQYKIRDIWKIENQLIRLDRTAACTRFTEETGIHLTTEFRVRGSRESSFDDYQFVIPGAFYNKNDTDGDGEEDYLGTYSQDYKDDRNPSMSVTAYAQKSQCFLSLLRADTPCKDTTITRRQIQKRHFIHDTDIGSLGLAPSEYHVGECILRCDYPFYERNTFCLNVDGSEWAAYQGVEEGTKLQMSYLLQAGEAERLTDASWQTTALQIDRLLQEEVPLPFTLEESIQYRRDMVLNSFREFPDKKGRPAGYFIHFSPRQSYGEQNLLEYGFCGAQTLLAYDMLSAAWEKGQHGTERFLQYRESARKTLDYFVENCVEESGLPIGLYSVDKEEIVYWWTGILLPFQYSHDRKELEDYLGNQIVGALMDIAGELAKVEGNYFRSMTDTMFYLMKSYLIEKENGQGHPEWLQAVLNFCERLLRIQNANGSWNRGYTMEGEPLAHPQEWFGRSEKEQGSGAIFPIPLLVEVYRYTKEEKYLESARKAAGFILRQYIGDTTYIGGINDTSHKKSVKMDAASVMFVMRSMLALYEQCGDAVYLSGAADAARILAGWTYLWDIPFDADTLLGRHGFRTTGWAGCDVIPAGSYVDCSFEEVVPEFLRIAEYCHDGRLARVAEAVTRGMQQGLSTPADMYGYAMPGVQCEGYMTSLWLADTEYKEFSGAAAKNKGDDNDTCNGFVNGMTLLNLDSLKRKYGTLDFGNICKNLYNK
ncbi:MULTISPECIES: hypothetical protein [Clostridia]|uniref:hypothetical protein n=1 Tax=Clostridia TaxID=186801 RepID=UPI00067EB39D|nr:MULTISPECIES: hypothetical protein [Clostridia]